MTIAFIFVPAAPYMFVLGLPLLFFCVWVFNMFLISRMSGWHLLSQRFRAAKFEGLYIRPWCATMRQGANFSNALHIGATSGELRLGTIWLYRSTFLPPLAIPWREITEEKSPWWCFFQPITFRLGFEEQIPLRVTRKIADEIRQAAGRKIEAVQGNTA